MSFQLIIREGAEADIAGAADWYEAQQAGLGVEFVAEAKRAIRWAASHPLVNRLMRREPEVRRVLMKRFPYRVFYIVRPHAVVVFAVLHGARHEARWKGRL
jgi:plasmid stabilization system protein ParE